MAELGTSGVRRQPQSAKARDQSAGLSRTCRTAPPVPPAFLQNPLDLPSSASASFEYRPCFVAARRMRSIPSGGSVGPVLEAAMYATRSVGHRWTPTASFLFGSSLHIGGPSRNRQGGFPFLSHPRRFRRGVPCDFKRHPPPPRSPVVSSPCTRACWFTCCPAGIAKSITPGRLL